MKKQGEYNLEWMNEIGRDQEGKAESKKIDDGGPVDNSIPTFTPLLSKGKQQLLKQKGGRGRMKAKKSEQNYRECKNCGKRFYASDFKLQRGGGNYCRFKCADQHFQSQLALCEYYRRSKPLSFEVIRQMITRGDTPGMIEQWQKQISAKAAGDWYQVA